MVLINVKSLQIRKMLGWSKTISLENGNILSHLNALPTK